jgi:hypothetical protein
MPGGTPYTDTVLPVPGTIQAEDFDEGGEGIAYQDSTTGNAGGQYRAGVNVDIGGNSANGYNVAWATPGEWLEHTVDVVATDNSPSHGTAWPRAATR